MEKIKLVEMRVKFEKVLFNWCFVPGFVILKEKVQDLEKQKNNCQESQEREREEKGCPVKTSEESCILRVSPPPTPSSLLHSFLV
jgi:hypothetical protein